MKNPFLKTPLLLNIFILIISGIISVFTLLFGLAHLYEAIFGSSSQETVSSIPPGEMLLGGIMVSLLIIIGIVAMLAAVTSIKGIIHKFKRRAS